MATKKRKSPGLIWRVLFGHNGPTRAAIRKEFGPKPVASIQIDPDTGKPKAKNLKQDSNGVWRYTPPKTRKNNTVKQRIAENDERNRRAGW
jgi:hypothetical protein